LILAFVFGVTLKLFIMKTPLFFKKIALVGFFFLAATQLFAQSVYTQNVSDSGACDGSAYLDSTIIATATDILWIEANTGIQTGGVYISNLCEGTYSVSYTDGQGNTVSETFTIGSNSSNPCAGFYVQLNSTMLSTPTSCDGTASVQAYGGTSPYSYYWSNNEVQSTITNLCSGYFTCNVVDANGCQSTGTVWIASDSLNNFDTTVVIINDTYPGDSILDNIGSQLVADCNLDIEQVASATITNSVVNNSSVDLTWTLYDAQGNVLAIYTENYPTVIDSTGIYEATVVITCIGKSLDNFQLTITDQVVLSGVASVSENSLNAIKYTNPIAEELAIQFPLNADYQVSIVDLSGKNVYINSFNNTSTANISTAKLNAGTYILTISTKTEQIAVKLVK
jgi:hypothetical protein